MSLEINHKYWLGYFLKQSTSLAFQVNRYKSLQSNVLMDREKKYKNKQLKIIYCWIKKTCYYKLQMLPLAKFDIVEKNEKVIHCT